MATEYKMAERSFFIDVVDDEECVRKALSRLFRSAGFQVRTFATGQEFLSAAGVNQPDCLVLDLHLPGMSGLEILKQMAQRGLNVPAVVITGHDEAGVREKAFLSGAAAYLLKPINDQELIASVIQSAQKSGE
jgi:FixJ family two-component response regulator